MKRRKIVVCKVSFLLLCLIAGIFVFACPSGLRPGHTSAQTTTEQRDLTAEERRGWQIYYSGESGSEGIPAIMSGDGVEVPASVVTCDSCHGLYGEGRDEGGVSAGDITWSYLTKPHVHEGSGRKHPAFTDASFKKAITFGVDPGGNAIEVSMPRYKMTQQQMSDLIAFLKRIETVPPPLWGTWEVTANAGGKTFTFYLILNLEGKVGGESKFADWEKVTGRKTKSAGIPEESDPEITSGAWKDGELWLVFEDENGRMFLTGRLADRKLSGDYTNDGGRTVRNWVAVRQ